MAPLGLDSINLNSDLQFGESSNNLGRISLGPNTKGDGGGMGPIGDPVRIMNDLVSIVGDLIRYSCMLFFIFLVIATIILAKVIGALVSCLNNLHNPIKKVS